MKALVPLADGFEEIEAVTIIDILRRAEIDVTSAAVADNIVTGSRGVRVCADELWNETDPEDYSMIVLPGGMGGATALSRDSRLLDALRAFASRDRITSAVCAGPLVLQAAGILEGRKATCHPSLKQNLSVPEWINERVVTDGNIVTSQGPGTTIEFALELVRLAGNADAATAIAAAVLLKNA